MLRKPPNPYEMYKNLPRLQLDLVTREEWGAKPATKEEKFTKFPVENVVFGYTDTDPCEDKESCMRLMRKLQEKHMSEGQSDIRYSFVVGADGQVYEGRGSQVKAGHHYRFPELNGNNYEIVHTRKRGLTPETGLPPADISSVAWQYLEKLEYDGLVLQKPKYYQDYYDPIPDIDPESLIIEGDEDVLENLNID